MVQPCLCRTWVWNATAEGKSDSRCRISVPFGGTVAGGSSFCPRYVHASIHADRQIARFHQPVYLDACGVTLNEATGSFEIWLLPGNELDVFHGSLGRSAVPMSCHAVVVELSQPPAKVYVGCGMAGAIAAAACGSKHRRPHGRRSILITDRIVRQDFKNLAAFGIRVKVLLDLTTPRKLNLSTSTSRSISATPNPPTSTPCSSQLKQKYTATFAKLRVGQLQPGREKTLRDPIRSRSLRRQHRG